jgi:hypothetical protein
MSNLATRSAPLLALTLSVVGLVAIAAPAGRAQPLPAQSLATIDPRPMFAGAWRFAGGQHERDSVSGAIERVVSQMFLLAQPFARHELAARNPVFPHVLVRVPPGTIELVLGSETWTGPDNGNEVPWAQGASDHILVSLRFVGQRLIQAIHNPQGSRRNEYAVSPDRSTLTMTVTMGSPQLPGQIRYALTYRR